MWLLRSCSSMDLCYVLMLCIRIYDLIARCGRCGLRSILIIMKLLNLIFKQKNLALELKHKKIEPHSKKVSMF